MIMKPLKILFADDDLKYALILKRFLEAEGYEVYYAGNGRIALEQYPEVKPDLILLDINMPEVNGYEVARQIREKDKHTLIFFLTDRTDKTDRLEGFKVRANDYLSKPFYPEELIARIRERFDSLDESNEKEVYTFGYTTFDYTNNELRTSANKVLITSRQAEILRLLVKHMNSAVSRETILEQVWGVASHTNSLALNVQISYLRKALRNDASVQIESLMKKGYIIKVAQ
jgi:DNA-binding response OmpR family regulator